MAEISAEGEVAGLVRVESGRPARMRVWPIPDLAEVLTSSIQIGLDRQPCE